MKVRSGAMVISTIAVAMAMGLVTLVEAEYCDATTINASHVVPNHNHCRDVQPLTPFCANMRGAWTCVECVRNCDCRPGKYCQKYGPGAGTCASVFSASRGDFERACIPVAQGWIPTKGKDDELVCGLPAFDPKNKFVGYEWLGQCLRGRCYECDPGSPTHSDNDPASIQCPGQECDRGLAKSAAGRDLKAQAESGATIAILALVAVGFQLQVLKFFIKLCRSRRAIRQSAAGDCDAVRQAPDKRRRFGSMALPLTVQGPQQLRIPEIPIQDVLDEDQDMRSDCLPRKRAVALVAEVGKRQQQPQQPIQQQPTVFTPSTPDYQSSGGGIKERALMQQNLI